MAPVAHLSWLPLLVMAAFIVGFVLFLAARSRRIGSFGTAAAAMFFGVALLWFLGIRSRPQFMESMVAAPPPLKRAVPQTPLPPAPLDANDLENLPADGARVQAEAPLADDGHTPLPSERIDDQKTRPTANPNPRPAWVDTFAVREGKVYRTHVEVGDYATREECERELPDALREVVKHYVDRLVGAGAGERTVARLPLPYIHTHLIKGEWEEHLKASFGPMVRLHELLEFDPRANVYLTDLHQQALVAERLKYTAVATGGLLGLLATVFGYLKLDTLTRGYYTGRLRMGTVAAVVAIIAGLLAVA